jgi:hypothetical protein
MSWDVIVSDDARANHQRLRPDPQIDREDGFWLYCGIIDVTNVVELLTADFHRREGRRNLVNLPISR